VFEVLPGAVRVGELDGAFAVAADRFRGALEHFADEAHGLWGGGVGEHFQDGDGGDERCERRFEDAECQAVAMPPK